MTTPSKERVRKKIAQILVKWGMPTRQAAINDILSLRPEEKGCECPCHNENYGGSYCSMPGVTICDKCGKSMKSSCHSSKGSFAGVDREKEEYLDSKREEKHPDFCTASVKEPAYMHHKDCPLVAPSTTEEKVCGLCKQPFRGGTLCPHVASIESEDWERKWDEMIGLVLKLGYPNSPNLMGELKKELVSFIRCLLSSSRAKEREEMLKALPEERIIHEYMPSQNTGENRGWNEYRNAAIIALAKIKQK